MKKKSLRFLSAGLMSLLLSNGLNAQMDDNLLFTAKLDGAQEVPVVITNAMGVATFMLNDQRTQLCINVAVNGLSGPITAAHIHDGAMGVSGGPIIDLSSGISGNQIAFNLTGTDLTSTLIEKLINGGAYINVHTAANSNGEIRGQIMLETDLSYVGAATGAQEVPAVVTAAYGLGVFTLSQDESTVSYMIINQGLSGSIISAHLHIGPVGVSGGPVEDLTTDISGNVITGTFVPTPTLLAALKQGDVYFNVHTAANPNGEIRGQLNLEAGLSFDARLTGDQEIPMVVTTAKGIAKFTLNPLLNTVSYDVVCDGLSGAIVSAHIHVGVFGTSGVPVVDLTGAISGNRISGTLSGATVSTNLINSLLKGEYYVNVHTAANPNGEIRGQIYRLAREGYTSILDGGQEVPANSSTAYGAGYASVNRDETNLHYMFVVGDLTSAVTSAHFHYAAVGVDGLPVFDISSSFGGLLTDDSAEGYLTSGDATPFTSTESQLFVDGDMYVNVHNVDYTGGEIRGQMNPGVVCYSLVSLNELDSEEVNVYPNPFTDLLMLSTDELMSLAKVSIVNMDGKEILTVIPSGTEELKINTNSLLPGMYILKTTMMDGSSSQTSVVKQ